MVSDRPYIIESFPEHNMVRAKVMGHWDMQLTEAFQQEILGAVLRARQAGKGPAVLLINGIDSGVQSREVIEKIEQFMPTLLAQVGKTALVTGSVLHKMQMDRVNPSDTQMTFRSEEEAMAWLLAEPEA